VDERALDELRRLAERDGELAQRGSELRRLDEEVAAIRGAVEAALAFLDAHPEEERRRAAERDAAAGELADRRIELAAAERAVADAGGDEEARLHADRARARAADHVAVAQARVDRAEAAVAELDHELARVPAELPALLARAQRVEAIAPPGETAELVAWASHAHAELFVATRQIDAQRERVLREANELASMLLGEATYGATAAQALARAEAHWVSSPGHVSDSR
jgi:chromosome segregation ATPase